METDLINIQIDGKHYQAKPGKNLLETCLALGLDLPYFCYHPALGSVGSCRQCAVKKFKGDDDTKGKIIMSCMEPVADGMIISIEDAEAKEFRASIIENLMLNHPHDCPVCDEGGECHLQDMTVMTGHNYRRNRFEKRTYENQYLGPFINHEMNRCIQCYRCVRFYRDYAGGKDLDVFAAHDHVYFGRHKEGILENEFSGNLVEVCPTGVFTDKTAKKHYTRKWDLTNTPSVCMHCSVGCNTIAGERYGNLRRIMSRYNGSVNGYFLCDRGRFGYEFVNQDTRIRKPQIRTSKETGLEEASGDMLISALRNALPDSGRIAGIGSPRASLEANYALLVLVGKENFYKGISATEHILTQLAVRILQEGNFHSPSLKEIEKADAVFILGEDLTNTAPMIALAVRQASRTVPMEMAAKPDIPKWNDSAMRNSIQDKKSPVYIANPFKTNLDELAEAKYNATPENIARLGFSVASILKTAVEGKDIPENAEFKIAREIAKTLMQAKNPVIITGIHSGSAEILKAAANIATALSSTHNKVNLSIVFPEVNSLGLGMMDGKPLSEAIGLDKQQNADTLIILENDLYHRADKELIDNFLNQCKNVIVLDHLMNDTAKKATILLPVGTFAESEGTVVNNEGRAQRFYRVLPPEASLPESWRMIDELLKISGKSGQDTWENFDRIVSDMTDALPVFAKIKNHLPDADFRMLSEKIKRQTSRFSGRTAMNAGINISEPKPPEDPDSPLIFSMEGTDENPPSSLVPFYWKPGWNSYQAMNFYLDEPNGSMKGGDPGIRLIERKNNTGIPFYKHEDSTVRPKPGEWLVVPVYSIFGSEELSSKAPAVAERIPEPFVLVNKNDADSIMKTENGLLKLEIAERKIEVALRIDNSVPTGVVGLSVNLPGMEFFDLLATGRFSK